MKTVSVLFARKDSVYNALLDVDVWDMERGAQNWPGGNPCVAHPPCRNWGKLRAFSKGEKAEEQLALWSVDQVRTYGGVLEHPYNSLLWPSAGLPVPGEFDSFGGWTYYVELRWFGFPARKPTWLYIVGVKPDETPLIPFMLGEEPRVVATHSKGKKSREIPKPWRDATPGAMAQWLVDVARKSNRG